MKHVWMYLVILSCFALTAFGCGTSSNPMESSQPVDSRSISYLPDEYCGDSLTVDLIAGQHTDVGSVIVTNDGNYLYVEFIAEDPWVITETHVSVSDSLDGIPQTKKGNPKIGNFGYNVDSFIDISMWPAGTTLYIAAHAVVQMIGENNVPIQEETAWGEGLEFPGNSWAMYFTYTVQDCCVDLGLPEDAINIMVQFGSTTYIDTTTWNVPAGFDVSNGIYEGWCSDKYHLIYVGTTYSAYIFNSYAPDTMPDDPRLDIPWDKINWIINNHDGYTAAETQAAIWWFSDQFPYSGNVGNLIADADLYGDGFVPGPGENIAVIVYVTDPSVQVTIIEVPTQCV